LHLLLTYVFTDLNQGKIFRFGFNIDPKRLLHYYLNLMVRELCRKDFGNENIREEMGI